MSIQYELERLAEMHRAGTLSDDEFTAAKSKVLAGNQETLGKAANKFVKLMAGGFGITVVLILAFFFLFFLPQWQRMWGEREASIQQFQKSKESFEREFDKSFSKGRSRSTSGSRLDQAQ